MFICKNVNKPIFNFSSYKLINCKLFGNEIPDFASFEHNYNKEEKEIILERLNTCGAEELCRYSVSLARSKRIAIHRKKHGNFKDLQDVLTVDGFGVKVLKSICQNILNPPDMNELPVRKSKNYNFVTPEVTLDAAESTRTVIGVAIGTLSVSWAGVELKNNNLFCWNYHELPLSPEVKKHHETQILTAAYDACKHIPIADAYVMESSSNSGASQQATNIPVNQQRLQLSSMLLVLLNRDREDQNCVYYQRNALWCRMYGTLVGSERVSSQSVVEDMLSGAPGPYSPLQADDHLISNYYAYGPVVREAMNAALLLTTCFLDVNVRKKAECLAVLRGRSKRS